MTIHVVFEGTDGMGKTTQWNRCVKSLRAAGYNVKDTREPGSLWQPITMIFRNWMLDPKYQEDAALLRREILAMLEDPTNTAFLTVHARVFLRIVASGNIATVQPMERELISQAIRSIHHKLLLQPTVESKTYDYIIQDRGTLSGLAYGQSRGNEAQWLSDLAMMVTDTTSLEEAIGFYTHIIYFHGDVAKGLARSHAARGGAPADVIERDGVEGMKKVVKGFDDFIPVCKRVLGDRFVSIEMEGKTEDEVEALVKAVIPVQRKKRARVCKRTHLQCVPGEQRKKAKLDEEETAT